MKVYICLFICLLFVSVGVNMAHDEMFEDNDLAHRLVKRRSINSDRRYRTKRSCCRWGG
uniref:CRP-I 12 n=1 Tax=Mytilus galloprovincialis TaxID=29158 RepID=A0A0A7ACN5_MYTGA|nr:CRP-I 12 [Mytilus galloprovincialis]